MEERESGAWVELRPALPKTEKQIGFPRRDAYFLSQS
jgi:hypothetical protein